MKVLSSKQAKAVKTKHRGPGRSPSKFSVEVCKLKIGQAILLDVPKGRKPYEFTNSIRGRLVNKTSFARKQGVRVSVNQTTDGRVMVTRRK